MRIELSRDQQASVAGFTDDAQGVTSLELHGSRLSVVGWYDQFVVWHVDLTLTDEQMTALHQATKPPETENAT